ncbi:MAG: hypothetical protein WCR30_03405 [Clostridia bacterium]
MDLIIWAKTLLTVQKYQKRVIGALGEIVKKRALASINNGAENHAMSVSNEILKLLERKDNLSGLYALTNMALASIKEESAKILIRSFFDEVQKEKIASEFGFCERTAYRKIGNALSEFSSFIESKGFNCENLFKLCKTEDWILNTYKWIETDTNAKNSKAPFSIINVLSKKQDRQFEL